MRIGLDWFGEPQPPAEHCNGSFGRSDWVLRLIEAQKELPNALKSREQVHLADSSGGKLDRFDGDLEKFLPWRSKATSYSCSIRKENGCERENLGCSSHVWAICGSHRPDRQQREIEKRLVRRPL